MASILLTTKKSEGASLLLRLVQEGNIGKIYTEESSNILSGYTNPMKMSSIKMLEQFDIVINGAPGNGELIDEIKNKNILTLGGGSFTDKLYEDLSYQEAVHTSLLNLPRWNNEDGVHLNLTGWFNTKYEFTWFNYYLNYERMFEGDRGSLTPSMGSCVWAADEGDRFIAKLFPPLIPLLKEVNYTGPINIEFVFTEDKIYIKSLSACFLYDTTQALTELMKEGLFSFLWSVHQGEKIKFPNLYGLSVRMSLPPYPYETNWEESGMIGTSFLGIPNGARTHLFLNDVLLHEGKECFAGINGNLGCATARGEDIREARSRAYRTLKNIIGDPMIQYRNDIGAGVETKIESAKSWEWMNQNA